MAEQADALDSGSSPCKWVEVQVLLAAPNARNPNYPTVFSIGESFGFILFFDYPNFNRKQ